MNDRHIVCPACGYAVAPWELDLDPMDYEFEPGEFSCERCGSPFLVSTRITVEWSCMPQTAKTIPPPRNERHKSKTK